jgi:hypothetical protein
MFGKTIRKKYASYLGSLGARKCEDDSTILIGGGVVLTARA